MVVILNPSFLIQPGSLSSGTTFDSALFGLVIS